MVLGEEEAPLVEAVEAVEEAKTKGVEGAPCALAELGNPRKLPD